MSKTITGLLLVITILCISPVPSIAHENSWKLIFLSHDTLTVSRLNYLTYSTLFATCDGRVTPFPIDSIAMLIGLKEGDFMDGAKIGFLVGSSSGVLIGAVGGAVLSKPGAGWIGNSPYVYRPATAIVFGIGGGIFGSVLGFFTGGCIASASSFGEQFDFSTKNHVDKFTILSQLLQRQQQIN